MPEHLRALVVILVLAGAVFSLARRPALDLISEADFSRRRNLWFGLLVVAFLSHSFWLYAFIAGWILYFAGRREQNRVALFFILLLVIPDSAVDIPGFGFVNYLFALSHIRLLALVLLLPGFLILLQSGNTLPFGRPWPDRLLVSYLALTALLLFRDPDATFTSVMRACFNLFLDVFLPYFVVSRALRDMASFRDALLAFLLAAMVLAITGVFESARHWRLYGALLAAMEIPWDFGYLGRSGMLRASATVGQPIAMGYVMVVAIGFFLYLKDAVRSRLDRRLGGALLAAGLVVPLSRGPWVGAVSLLLAFVLTGRRPMQRMALLAIVGVFVLPLLAVLPVSDGKNAIDLLPFIGTVEKGGIDYRERLLENSMIVIERNLLFGSVDYLETPEMLEMIQGEGIIDLVNSYIQVALRKGIIGLGLFLGFFTIVLLGIRSAMLTIRDKGDEMYRLGQALFATLVGILVTIFTVSSITIIPVVYWSVAGLAVAYARMVRERTEPASQYAPH